MLQPSRLRSWGWDRQGVRPMVRCFAAGISEGSGTDSRTSRPCSAFAMIRLVDRDMSVDCPFPEDAGFILPTPESRVAYRPIQFGSEQSRVEQGTADPKCSTVIRSRPNLTPRHVTSIRSVVATGDYPNATGRYNSPLSVPPAT